VACLLIGPPVYLINILAVLRWSVQHHPLEQMVRDNPSGPVAMLALVSGVILAPAAEELVFRGVLQGWLMRVWPRPKAAFRPLDLLAELPEPGARLQDWVVTPRLPLAGIMPNLITSAIFAAIHLGQWPAPVPIFFLSLGLGVLYQRTGSLIAPFVLHAMFNGISTLGLFASLG
jgi:membrane protease YdiL (CAAX protease family)